MEANEVRWCRHVLRMDDEHGFRKALEFELRARESEDDQRKHGRRKWRRKARVLFWRKRMP